MLADTYYMKRVIHKITRERHRQESLIQTGKIIGDVKDPEEEDTLKLAILAEEFGEVANAVLESDRGNRSTREHMLLELIQVAAVACAWAESMERELHE